MVSNRNYRAPCPPFLVEWTFSRTFSLQPEVLNRLWDKLNRRETFTVGQLPPYRVEFVAPAQQGPFAAGEINIHHGPLLSAPGVITEVNSSYRGLDYFYGAYVISFRWVRPVRLEFFRDATTLKMQLTYYVAPWLLPIWKVVNSAIWRFFPYAIL